MDKIALVTGGGSGIGKAVAVALAGGGFRVVVAGRRHERLAEVVAESAGRCLALPADVSDPASVTALFERIASELGRLDVLFNNAGVNVGGPLDQLTLQDWRAVLDTNVTGVFLCAQAAFRLMKAQNPRGGRIINNGSIAASTPRPHAIAYTASKHAVSGITKSLALEGRPFDIACGQIDIGNAATDMTVNRAVGTLQADMSKQVEPTFDVTHVAQAVLQMALLPLSANVLSMTIMATKMPFVGRG
jgi:NAD(P)-dependent dehydrogenase (short-subunit alcohol dehydrogenase family)